MLTLDDLISRLTAAIDGLTALAQRVKAVYVYPEDHERAGEGYWPTPRVARVFSDYSLGHAVGLDLVKAFGPDQVLRGCTADRKLLAIHQPIKTFAGSEDFLPKRAGTPEFPIKVICERCANHDRESGWDDYDEDTRYPCETLRAVAERYGLEVDGG